MKKLSTVVYILAVLMLTIVYTMPANAGPKKLAKRIAHETGNTFADIKRHPFQWGIYAIATIGLNYADTASSCELVGTGSGYEAGPARFFIGRHPNCHKLVLFTSVVTPIELASFHAASNKFYEHCQAEAANPQSVFNSIDAANHSPEPCHYFLHYAALAADAPWHIAIIQHNLSLQ